MRVTLRLAPLFIAVIVCSATPALGSVRASDAKATHAYLKAELNEQRATAGGPAELKAIETLEAQVKEGCPGVLAGAPRYTNGEKPSQSQLEVSEELIGGVFGAGERAEHPVLARFARVVRGLRWSNSKLTRLLHSLAKEAAEQSAIPPPDLCADLKFWVASGYAKVSAGTKQVLHRMRVVSSITLIESEPHEPAANFLNVTKLVAYRLKPYEDQADRRLARKALPPEIKITDPRLRPFLEAVGKVYLALGDTASSPSPPANAGASSG